MIICAKCGHENQAGRIFCISCGAKLDLARAPRNEIFKEEKVGRFSAAWVIVPGLVALAALVVGLSLWPVKSSANHGNDADATSARAKIGRMNAAGTGAVAAVFSEAEVNAGLAAILKSIRKERGDEALVRALRSAEIVIRPEAVEVVMYTKAGPAELSYVVRGLPRRGPAGFVFEPSGGSIGHLPLPRLLVGTLLERLRALFSSAVTTRSFLDKVDDFEPGLSQIKLVMNGATAL